MVNRVKLGKSAKNRGNTLERDTAKQLADWSGKTFSRTPTSGANHALKAFGASADVMTTWDDWPYIIECKFYNDGWTLENVMKGNKHFPSWVAQSVREGQSEDAPFMLVFKRDYNHSFVMIPYTEELTNIISSYLVANILYVSEVTGGKETIKTMTFSMDDILAEEPKKFVKAYNKDWQNMISKVEEIKKPKNTINDTLKQIEEMRL